MVRDCINEVLFAAGLANKYYCKKMWNVAGTEETNAIIARFDDPDNPQIVFDCGWDKLKVHEFIRNLPLSEFK